MIDGSFIGSSQAHASCGESPGLARLQGRLVELLTSLSALSNELDGVTPRWISLSDNLTAAVKELQSFRPLTFDDRKARSSLLALLSDVLDENDPRVIELACAIAAETPASAQAPSSTSHTVSRDALRPFLIPRLFSWSDGSKSARSNGHSHG